MKSLPRSEKEDAIYLPKSKIWTDEGNFDDVKTFNLKFHNLKVNKPKDSSYKKFVKRKFGLDEPCNKICLEKVKK
jgi:hypothetical protein